MSGKALFSVLFAAVLLPVVVAGAADEDALLNDEDMIVDFGVNFDIPENATAWPDGREKISCSCRTNTDPADAWCEGRAMYFLVKLQNWGWDIAYNVTLVDELDDALEYVPGTTEIATDVDNYNVNVYRVWQPIPDGMNYTFPLAGEGYKVADYMEYCDQSTWFCADSLLIRFMVIPKEGIPANRIISNSAIIKEAGSDENTWYRTNRNVPLRLHKGVCLTKAECYEPSQRDCGGEIFSDDCVAFGCPDGFVCNEDTGICEEVAETDEDSTITDDSLIDNVTSDADTVKPKDGGCGCSLVF